MSDAAVRAGSILMVQPTRGMRGPPRTLFELARFLSTRRPVSVAAPRGFLLDSVASDAPEITRIELPTSDVRRRAWLAGSRTLLRATAREAPEVIHANGLSALNLVAPVALRHGVPVFVHFHAYELLRRSAFYLRVWRRLGVRMSLHPVSDFARGLLEATPAHDLVGDVVPNPIDMAEYAVERNGVERPVRIGFVGGRSPRKGLHLLIDIALRLRDEPVTWTIYGLKPDQPNRYIQECVARVESSGLADRFVWGGRFRRPIDAYANVDILLIPSLQESFCRVAVEGMAAGLPIVASRVAGLAEVVWEDVSGLLFDPREPDDAAAHLRRLLHDTTLRDRMREDAVRAASRFDVGRVGLMLERHYDALVSPPDASLAWRELR